MTVTLGINPITWTNDDDPALGGDTPLETCLSETRAASYLGTELGGKFPRESAVLGPILAKHRARTRRRDGMMAVFSRTRSRSNSQPCCRI